MLRTRVIDDWATKALVDGAKQVVLLGVGLDSRAYRLPAMGDVAVFEVDHPATLEVKRALVNRHVPLDRRGHVRFVAVDLLHDSLAEALRAAGFTTARTAVIWEGVTSYLDAASVDATISWFSRDTATGSRLIFTYLDACAIHGADGGNTELAGTFSSVGEPMTFGLHPGEVAGYLADRWHRPSPAGDVGGDQLPAQKGGTPSPINASTTPPFPLLRFWTTTLPVLPSGNSNVKVFPTAFLGPLPALLAGRKSPAHGGVPPLRAGSAKSAAVPGVLVPSEDRRTEVLR